MGSRHRLGNGGGRFSRRQVWETSIGETPTLGGKNDRKSNISARDDDHARVWEWHQGGEAQQSKSVGEMRNSPGGIAAVTGNRSR